MWSLLADFGKHANPYKNPLLGSSIAFLVAFASAFVGDTVYRRVDPWGNPAVWVSLVTAVVLLPSWILSTDRAKTFNETMLLKSRFRAPIVGIFTVGGKDETQIKNIMRGVCQPERVDPDPVEAWAYSEVDRIFEARV